MQWILAVLAIPIILGFCGFAYLALMGMAFHRVIDYSSSVRKLADPPCLLFFKESEVDLNVASFEKTLTVVGSTVEDGPCGAFSSGPEVVAFASWLRCQELVEANGSAAEMNGSAALPANCGLLFEPPPRFHDLRVQYEPLSWYDKCVFQAGPVIYALSVVLRSFGIMFLSDMMTTLGRRRVHKVGPCFFLFAMMVLRWSLMVPVFRCRSYDVVVASAYDGQHAGLLQLVGFLFLLLLSIAPFAFFRLRTRMVQGVDEPAQLRAINMRWLDYYSGTVACALVVHLLFVLGLGIGYWDPFPFDVSLTFSLDLSWSIAALLSSAKIAALFVSVLDVAMAVVLRLALLEGS